MANLLDRSNYLKEWHRRNPDAKKQYAKKYRETHREQTRIYANMYTKKHREHKLSISKAWNKENKGKRNSITAKYRATKLRATPRWADLEAIRKFYENCPEGMHVDHIIPLQGRNVSGLHVLSNLQYLSASENFSKGNKHE